MVASSLGALAALYVLTIAAVESTGLYAEAAAGAAGSVTLSNTQLPRDTAGNPLITGEASVLKAPDGNFYFYFNNWGECYCGAQYPWLESCCESKTW